MDTSQIGTQDVAATAKRSWRRHSPEFKARVIELARQPGTSVAAVTLANGLNANMLRRWVHEAAVDGGASKAAATGVGGLRAVADARQDRTAAWLAVQPLDMRLGTEAALARVVGASSAPHIRTM